MERIPGTKDLERVIERVHDVKDDPKQHIERLLSERRDGEASADDHAAIERAIAEDPANARSAEAYDRLHALLNDWRSVPETVDWKASARHVAERIRVDHSSRDDADERGFALTDKLVREHAGPMPPVDWSALSMRISNAVREEAGRSSHSRRSKRAWIVRVGAPLAAAAVLALAAIWWTTAGPKAPIDGGPGRESLVLVALDMPVAVGQVSISFDRSAAGAPDRTDEDSGGRAIAYGPRIKDNMDSDDDVYFY